VLAITIKGLWSHKRRLTGTFLAVLLGVAFLAGTLVLGDTVRSNFDTLFTSVTGDTGAVVRNAVKVDSNPASPRGPIDAALLDRVRAAPGVASVQPQVTGLGQIVGSDGKVLRTLGPPRAGNWITDPGLTPFRLASGRAPRTPDEVVINRGAAKDGDLRIGSRTTVDTPRPVPVTVVGIVTFQGADAFGGSSYTGFTLEGAQRHLGERPDQLNAILVKGESGVSQERLAANLRPLLPTGVEAITGQQLSDEGITDINQGFLGLFRTFLLVFAGIALFVAMFTIANTFAIIVAQRTREAALLRAIGASRRQVLWSVVLEALAVGVAASLLGLAAGVGVATGLKALFKVFGFPLPTSGLVLSPASVALSLGVGVGVTLLAAVLPAVRASRVAPLAAMREVAAEAPVTSRRRVLTGALLAVAGLGVAVAAVLAGGDRSAALAGTGSVLLVVGVVVLGPAAARPASRLLGAPLARLRGITGALAGQNAMRNPRRTSGAAVALMIGVAVVTLFTVFTASIQASIRQSVSTSFGGDLAVTSSGFAAPRLDPRMAGQIAALPQVREAVGIGGGTARVAGTAREVSVADGARLAGVLDLRTTAGSIGGLRGDWIAVADTVAEGQHWRLGQAVPVRYADGTSQTLTLGAIYQGGSQLVGDYLLPRAQWLPHAPGAADATVLIALKPGVGLEAGRVAVERVAAGYGQPEVQDRAQYSDSLSNMIGPGVTVVYALLVLAIVIALIGIANTLSLSIHERTRELGLLRAVGETRGQVRAMVRWESVIVALYGTIAGLGLGVLLGWVLVKTAGQGGTGAFAAPPGQLGIILLVGAVAGVLAGLRPARRAARLNLLTAIATE
jgi:putative ABC transport system permease protein